MSHYLPDIDNRIVGRCLPTDATASNASPRPAASTEAASLETGRNTGLPGTTHDR